MCSTCRVTVRTDRPLRAGLRSGNSGSRDPGPAVAAARQLLARLTRGLRLSGVQRLLRDDRVVVRPLDRPTRRTGPPTTDCSGPGPKLNASSKSTSPRLGCPSSRGIPLDSVSDGGRTALDRSVRRKGRRQTAGGRRPSCLSAATEWIKGHCRGGVTARPPPPRTPLPGSWTGSARVAAARVARPFQDPEGRWWVAAVRPWRPTRPAPGKTLAGRRAYGC